MECYYLYIATYYIHEEKNSRSHDLSHFKKIGTTGNIQRRMNSLSGGGTKCPIKCKAIVSWESSKDICKQLEKDLMEAFKDFHVDGEWFDDDERLVKFAVKEINKLIKQGYNIKKLF